MHYKASRKMFYEFKGTQSRIPDHAQNDPILKKLVRNFKLIEHGGVRYNVISGFVNYFTLHIIHNMQSSGRSHQSHRLSEQHGKQPRDEDEVGKIHGGKRTELCCSFSAILQYCARAPKQPSAVTR